MSIIAASFAAVPTSLSLPYSTVDLSGLALWNPVLDLRRTFVEPELPWGKVNYSSAQQALLHSQGFLLIGDRDSYVSYEIASATASASASCTFHMVDASDHGFDSREREDEAIAVTVEWLINEHGKQE